MECTYALIALKIIIAQEKYNLKSEMKTYSVRSTKCLFYFSELNETLSENIQCIQLKASYSSELSKSNRIILS